MKKEEIIERLKRIGYSVVEDDMNRLDFKLDSNPNIKAKREEEEMWICFDWYSTKRGYMFSYVVDYCVGIITIEDILNSDNYSLKFKRMVMFNIDLFYYEDE